MRSITRPIAKDPRPARAETTVSGFCKEVLMPFIWIRDDDRIWSALPLTDHPVDFSHSIPKESSTEDFVNAQIEGAFLFPVGDDRPIKTWALLWGRDRDVRVNGLRSFPVGIRVIADRDEIKVDTGEAIYFTAETLPVVETFQGSDHDIFCPRDKKKIEPGSQIVRCVECGLIYHYNTDKAHNCFEYSELCLCGHPTRLDAGFRWVPDDTCD
jgi:hypothetical protein